MVGLTATLTKYRVALRPRFPTSQSTGHIPTTTSPSVKRAPQRAMSLGVPIAEKNVAIFVGAQLRWEYGHI